MKKKNKSKKDFSHIETDRLRATFIENPQKAKELQKGCLTPDGLVVNVGEYLNSNDPFLKTAKSSFRDSVLS